MFRLLNVQEFEKLRYSHATYCTSKFEQQVPTLKDVSANTKLKNRIAKEQSECDNLRQAKPDPPMYNVAQIPILQVRMNTAREKKQDTYNELTENAFWNYFINIFKLC